MKIFIYTFIFLVIATVCVVGFRGQRSTKPPVEVFNDMDRQYKVKAQQGSTFFSDGSGTRHPVAGTVPRGGYSEDEYLSTGKMKTTYGDGIPVKIDLAAMKRGQERFGIYCAVCHGATGAGNGVVTEYGFAGVANLQSDRILKMSDGELFDIITHGKGQMGAYGGNISVQDRWLIVAYLRALQRSQHGTAADIPEDEGDVNPYE
ncbi:MAG: cytochrome c [Verrucomicrobiota bacterium]|nr:cytochrome c [Verrucomicrobiota bacterium]